MMIAGGASLGAEPESNILPVVLIRTGIMDFGWGIEQMTCFFNAKYNKQKLRRTTSKLAIMVLLMIIICK